MQLGPQFLGLSVDAEVRDLTMVGTLRIGTLRGCVRTRSGIDGTGGTRAHTLRAR